MLQFCTSATEKAALNKLIDLCARKIIKGTQGWSYFSNPTKLPKTLPEGVSFSSSELKDFGSIKKALVDALLKKCNRKCSYCRRAVGRYGFAWHIEHFKPKSRHADLTFDFSNLSIGCVDCNRWKGSKVDRDDAQLDAIINPLAKGFSYGRHLKYIHIATEDIALIKYIQLDDPGKATYDALNFREIERTTLMNSMNHALSDFTAEFGSTVIKLSQNPNGQRLAALLQKLKSDIYDVDLRTTDE